MGKQFFFLIILYMVLLFLPDQSYAAERCSIVVQEMQCEYLTNPKGLDERLPRFSWTLLPADPHKYGQRQTAYRIWVADSKEAIRKCYGNIGDTGWIESDQMNQIEYVGKGLISDHKYYWRVQVRDEQGIESAYSDIACWTTGILNEEEWHAEWIGSDQEYDIVSNECTVYDPWLRKNVLLSEQPMQAVLFVASIGYHELYVNGTKIGDNILEPCVSNHEGRARYIAYDIASYLNKGNNTIGLWLGASWSIFEYYKTKDRPYTPIVKAQATIYGKKKIKPIACITTDSTWKFHYSPNKLIGAWKPGNYGGEIWDANKNIPDWNSVNYDDVSWNNAIVYHPVGIALSSQNVEGNKLFKEIHPVDIEERSDGSYKVDMGVNFSGWTRINLNGDSNGRVDILFSENKNEDVSFDLRSAYILDESGKGVFQNRFNYSSGRWILLKGLRQKPTLEDIVGWNIRTDYEKASTFLCSDSLQNWIYNTVLWTFENLSLGGYVVDCQQRERLGYGGDAHATSETAIYNYKMGAFYTKWIQDWRDLQNRQSNSDERIKGSLPHTSPTIIGGGGPSWGGICILLPWHIYRQYGDERILSSNFDMIKNWIQFLDSNTKNGILERYGKDWDFLSDWLWPGATAEGMNENKAQSVCFNSCFMVYSLRTAAKIAEILGEKQEAGQWNDQANRMSEAIHNRFYDVEDRSYCDKSMGNMTLALIAEVVPPSLRQIVEKRLENEILVVRKGHINVGITGGAFLFSLLRNMKRDDLLFSMTSQTSYPSWGFMKANDATTIWEMWEKDLKWHSLMHSSFLYPGAWYINGIGGIYRHGDLPGYKTFVISPPSLTEEQMQWANTTFNSASGRIRSYWKREKGVLTMDVTIPPNTHAELWFPSLDINQINISPIKIKEERQEGIYTIFRLKPGIYHFSGIETVKNNN